MILFQRLNQLKRVMKVHYDLQNLPRFKKAVVTLGTFDGVHRGHRCLIENIISESKRIGGESLLLTFDQHPRSVIRPEEPSPKLLTTLDEKIELLKPLRIDHLVVLPFTKEFSLLTAREYVSDFLVRLFKPSVIVIGYNHRFGHHRDGNIELLNKLAPEFGFAVKEISKQLINEIDVSSTRIRLALEEGDVTTAAELLGYPYTVSGTVISGEKIGRTLGFPTANLHPRSNLKLIPANGVYVTKCKIDEIWLSSVTNIGTRPTIGGAQRRIESYVIDQNLDLYNRDISIQFLARLRPEKKFDNVENLSAQIKEDVAIAREYQSR